MLILNYSSSQIYLALKLYKIAESGRTSTTMHQMILSH